MVENTMKKLNNYAQIEVSVGLIDWIDDNLNTVINSSVLDDLKYDLNDSDYQAFNRLFEDACDYYDATSFEELSQDFKEDIATMLGLDQFDDIIDGINDYRNSLKLNGYGSMFAQGSNIFDGALIVDDLMTFLNNNE